MTGGKETGVHSRPSESVWSSRHPAAQLHHTGHCIALHAIAHQGPRLHTFARQTTVSPTFIARCCTPLRTSPPLPAGVPLHIPALHTIALLPFGADVPRQQPGKVPRKVRCLALGRLQELGGLRPPRRRYRRLRGVLRLLPTPCREEKMRMCF